VNQGSLANIIDNDRTLPRDLSSSWIYRPFQRLNTSTAGRRCSPGRARSALKRKAWASRRHCPLKIVSGSCSTETYHSSRMRIRPGSMTEKWPCQPSRAMTTAICRPASPAFLIGIRTRTMPHDAGSFVALAISPKSLSKVSKGGSSLAPHASTSESPMPGATVLIQTTSCPAACGDS
jgi:hypothetical protein